MSTNNQYHGGNRYPNQNQVRQNQQSQHTSVKYDFKFWQESTDKKIVNPKLFSEEAKKIADNFNSSKTGEKNKNKNNPTQIRKFYDEILKYKTLIKDENDFKKYHAYINMLIPKAAYSKGRNLVTQEFTEFIKYSLSLINDYKDFIVFVNLFESVIAYYKELNPSEK